MPFRIVVRPWGPDAVVTPTVLSEHATEHEAFAEIDWLVLELVRTGTEPRRISLVVVDESGAVVERERATHGDLSR